jgi:murein DD-endopeptidase MepM/ murein hydrolase activator NlpD
MKLWDRLLTIVVTVTLTSAVWILIGSFYIDDFGAEDTKAGDAEVSASPTVEPVTGAAQAEPRETVAIEPLDPSERASLVIPVLGVSADQLSDTFSDDRGGGTRLHEALDIMAPRGTPVVAAAPGTIGRLFQSDAGGNTIYVRSEDRRTIHYYAHLDAYAPGLEEGQEVRRGQRLGTVGSSGNANPEAPHLHFAILRTTPDAEWWEPATAINPYPLLAGR